MDTPAVLTTVRDTHTARRVFGDPITVGDTTIIFVAKVRGGVHWLDSLRCAQ